MSGILTVQRKFPNIEGNHSLLYFSGAGWNGPFFNLNGGFGTGFAHVTDGTHNIWNVTLGFDASRINSTYGLSATNQPSALRSLALIRAY